MKIGIIGHGRFGKLWAKLMGEFGEVLIFDKRVESQKSIKSKVSEVLNVDILFLLVPISEIKNVCEEIKDLLPEKTIVIDTCSVKVKPAEEMRGILKNNQPIIATHPLFGPDSVKRMGLPGQKMAVCPVRVNDTQLQLLLDILSGLKLKIIKTTPEEHDMQMARSQALVHFLGRALHDLDLENQEISTPDYESLLKINDLVNNDTWQLFFDMHKYNPYAKRIRDKFIESLQDLEDKII